MFLVNSRLDLFTATKNSWAPLLPKLRGHFAEFLRESYLAPLGILNLPTCVGFGYGYNVFITLLAFLGTILHHSTVVTVSQTNQGVAISHASLIMLPHHSQGLFTLCPSTTPFDLALGPD